MSAETPPGAEKPKKGKHAGGRPTKYRPKYCEQIVKFFDIKHFEEKVVARASGKYEKVEYKEIANPPRFFSQFARSIKLEETSTLSDWARAHPEFKRALLRAKELQMEMIHVNSCKGLFDSKFVAYMIGPCRKTCAEGLFKEEVPAIDGLQAPGANHTTIVQIFRATKPAEAAEIARGGDPLKVLFGDGFDPNGNGKATNGR